MTSTSSSPSAPHTNRWRIVRWSLAAALLLLPLVAMQFTDEVQWTGFDFLVFGSMLLGLGLAYELAASASTNLAFRFGAGVAVVATFLLIWVNLAVGFLGSEDNPINGVFIGVLAIAFLGAAVARLKAPGMVRAMLATAGAQLLIGIVALALGWGTTYEIVMGTTLFTTLWLVSAGLFWKASKQLSAA